jgi:hypothetical protein
MKSCLPLILLFVILNNGVSQNDENMNTELPYFQIPDYPENYTAATVAARMIDGLGFRYYWATESLREEDLNFKPNDDARTVLETLDHIYSLSQVVVNATKNEPNISGKEKEEYSFEQLRRMTLENLKEASDLLKQNSEKSLDVYNLVFKRSETASEYPFWNLINGPIADAIWHVGQVVSFRRSSGNPLNSKVSVFTGKLRD